MRRFAVGIDLGTSNCALAAAPLDDKSAAPVTFEVQQVISPGEVAHRPLLPSCLYLPAEVEFAEGALALPWDKNARTLTGTLARATGAQTPTRMVASAKSWLSHAGVDRTSAILPWGAPDEVTHVSPVDASADAVARDLTVQAAHKAGLGESLRLLEEPQAAMYAWLAHRGPGWRSDVHVGDVILVIDLGGGTTDF